VKEQDVSFNMFEGLIPIVRLTLTNYFDSTLICSV